MSNHMHSFQHSHLCDFHDVVANITASQGHHSAVTEQRFHYKQLKQLKNNFMLVKLESAVIMKKIHTSHVIAHKKTRLISLF